MSGPKLMAVLIGCGLLVIVAVHVATDQFFSQIGAATGGGVNEMLRPDTPEERRQKERERAEEEKEERAERTAEKGGWKPKQDGWGR